MMGRVSFNPMRHIDPLGTIAIPLAMYFLTGGAFLFGYAKPVPVSFGNLRALGQPVGIARRLACNFVQALIWGVLTSCCPPSASTSRSSRGWRLPASARTRARRAEPVSVAAAGGGRILAALLPTKQSIALSRIEPYGFIIIVLVLVATGVLTNFGCARSSTSAMPS